MRAWIGGLAVLGMLATARPAHADPDALWKIVGGQCVPHQQAAGDPKPCAAVDLAGGTAVLKDIVGITQYLLIPTAKIAGIESPEILEPNAPDYFAAAWAARDFVEKAAGHTLPLDAIGLAINSQLARSQNQLHIHIDCLNVAVIDILHRHASEIGPAWAPFPVSLEGHDYLARRYDDKSVNPFRLLAETPGAAAAMGHQTLIMAGVVFPDNHPGVILLAGHVDLLHADFANGEDVQDHACAVAHRAG